MSHAYAVTLRAIMPKADPDAEETRAQQLDRRRLVHLIPDGEGAVGIGVSRLDEAAELVYVDLNDLGAVLAALGLTSRPGTWIAYTHPPEPDR